MDENTECLLLSATTLSAIRFFDVAKYHLLLNHIQTQSEKLRVRALVGWAFTHILHSDRVALYPELEWQLEQFAGSQSFLKVLEQLQLQLFLSIETKKMEKKLQEQILPHMMQHLKKK